MNMMEIEDGLTLVPTIIFNLLLYHTVASDVGASIKSARDGMAHIVLKYYASNFDTDLAGKTIQAIDDAVIRGGLTERKEAGYLEAREVLESILKEQNIAVRGVEKLKAKIAEIEYQIPPAAENFEKALYGLMRRNMEFQSQVRKA